MARAKALMRLARKKLNRAKPIAQLGAVGAFSGAAAGFSGSQAGLKGAGAKEGAVTGGVATAASAVVFRRIRGRLIPIRVKRK